MNNIINISDFNEIAKGIKSMKADLVYVKGNTLYGTDNNFTILKTYILDTIVPIKPFTIITKTLSSEFFNSIVDIYIKIDTDINKIYCTANRSIVEDYPEMINNRYNDRIESIVSNINLSTNSQFTRCIYFGEITNDENFQRFKTIKSGEGADLYIPCNNTEYSMYLYSGAIPMIKSDKIILNIFDLGNTFIANFQIIKKKNNIVNLYIKYVKLQNNVYRA